MDREYLVSTAMEKHPVKNSTCKILPEGHNHSALPRTETPNLRSSSNSSLAFITHSPLLQSSRILFHLILAPKPEEPCIPPFIYVEILPSKGYNLQSVFLWEAFFTTFHSNREPPSSSMLFSGPPCWVNAFACYFFILCDWLPLLSHRYW